MVDGPARRVLAALDELRPLLRDPSEREARRLGWGMARTYQAALLCEAAGWALDKHGDARAVTALALLASGPLVGPDPGVDDHALGRLAFD